MGTVFLHGNGGSGGSGGGMELTIIVDTVRPAKVTHNAIWVDSDVDATSYALTAAEPENPEPGALWISIGDGGKIKVVSPVGDNWITVYLISAKQFIDGAWVDKVAKSYQNGEWVDWWHGELYISGKEYSGGFIAVGMAYSSSYNKTNLPTIQENDDSMTFTQEGNQSGGAVVLSDKIDLSKFKVLYFDGTITQKGTAGSTGIGVWTELGTYLDSNRVAALSGNITGGVSTLALDGINTECYVGFYIYHSGSTVTVNRMWLE